jgi:hypothetical protein
VESLNSRERTQRTQRKGIAANRDHEWTRIGNANGPAFARPTARRAAKRETDQPRMDQPSREAMAGKLQIYADEGTPGALHQSPDEQELVPTVRTFASLREILSSLT